MYVHSKDNESLGLEIRGGKMLKVICSACQVAMKVQDVGVCVVEMFLDPPQPYMVWSTDTMRCPICKHEVATGFGNKPLYEHHEEDFNKNLARILTRFEKGEIKVIICYEFPLVTSFSTCDI